MDPALKQRLIGAAVLIALAIIFVPMLLSGPGPKQDNATVNLDIPPPPEREFQTRMVPAEGGRATQPSPPAAAPAVPASSTTPPDADKVTTVEAGRNPRVEVPTETPSAAAAPRSGAAKPAAAKPEEAKPAPVADAKPADKPGAETKAAADGRFLVHLGVYASSANAEKLAQAARKANLPALSEATEADGKPATRVRLGPFATRAGAEAARLKFAQAEPKVPASIVEVTPESPRGDAPASALPAAKPGGWAVQLGAFKTQDEANKLRDKVKAGGFAVFVEPVGQGDARLWRVRVGPQADRGGAEKARDQLKSKLALNGNIVTQP